MKISILSFTEKGRRLSEEIARKNTKMEIELFTKQKSFLDKSRLSSVLFVEESVGHWAKIQMQERNAMLFIGACGIAVRAIAPYLTDKLHDSPVLVMDEKGRYVIPILSGHMGGANELALFLANMMNAIPVITTATDLNKKFSVDLFAKKNGLWIVNKEGIAKVSSKVLDGKEIRISIEPKYIDSIEEMKLPMGVKLLPYPPIEKIDSADIVITSKEETVSANLFLRPKEYIIGMGCKKGKKQEEIADFITRTLDNLGISITQVLALSSISQKSKELGILAWCKKENIPLITYTAEELQALEGNFKTSSFVQNQVGVDNVCERAAVKACGRGQLIYEKCAENGMTIAVAKREWRVRFYDK